MPRLYRRGNIFYFRATVPHKWRTAIKALEIKFSLQTDNRSLAKIRCRFLSNSFDIFFREENLAKITIAQIHEVARRYFQDELNRALELATDVIDDPLINVDEEISSIQESRKKLQQTLASGKYDELCTHDAELIWKELAPEKTDLEMLEYLRRTITKAMILRKSYLISELTGTPYEGYTADPIFNGIMPTHIPPHPMSEEEEADKNDKPSLLLSDAIQDYVKLRKTSWTEKTQADHLRSLNLLTSVTGNDKKMTEVNKDDIIKIRDTLMSLPPKILLANTPLAKKYIAPNIDTEANEKLSYKTQDKYFSMIRTFLKWAVDEERISDMPGRNIKLTTNAKEAPIDARNPYSKSQLEKIFTSPLYRGCKSASRRSVIGSYKIKDAYYWIPLVALYSGMRLGEIVQLGVEDLKQEEGVWFFDVCLDEASNKKLKTKTSIRIVPVHKHLLNLGFLEYCRDAQAAKRSRIFHEIEPSASGSYSANFSKWWSHYMRKTNIRTPKTTFHSFRHNFTDALNEAQVSENISRHLLGHSSASSKDAHKSYGSRPTATLLQPSIDQIVYPVLEALWKDMPTKEQPSK